MNAQTAIMPLEEKYERALQSVGEKLAEAAQARGDAERLEGRLKQRKAILTLKHRKEAGSASMAETMALADREYELSLSEYETARIKHLLADSEAEKARLSFEAWRTQSSNRRAEMQLR